MDEIEKIAGPLGVLAVHTIAVYVCAVHLSPWLVGRVFYWILPLLGVHPSIAATDWYLQHLEIVTIVPALLLGLIAGYLLKTMSKLAWVLPTSVLLFEMLK